MSGQEFATRQERPADTGSDATSWTHIGRAPSTTYYYRHLGQLERDSDR